MLQRLNCLSTRQIEWLGRAVLAVGLLAGAFFLLGNHTRPRHEASTNTNGNERLISLSTPQVKPTHEPMVGMRPIESLRVGERVLAHNPEVTQAERDGFVEPDWNDWLQLSLAMPKSDGSLLEIELLRPESWVREQMGMVVEPSTAASTPEPTGEECFEAVPLSPLRPIFQDLAFTSAELEKSGQELQAIFVDMDLPELAITGPAIVSDIRSIPPINPGAGRVITATFRHSSGDVIDLVVGDSMSPLPHAGEVRLASSTQPQVSDTIGSTSNHPFWSVDRQEYVQAGKLELGERLHTYSGDTKYVVSKLARPGPQPVYNLEVFAEHVYYVGSDGLLVHNSQHYSLGNVSTGEGRVHITYRGEKAGGSYTGYASLPIAAVKGLSKAEAEALILSTRYGGDFSKFTNVPTVVYFGKGIKGKQTARGLEHHGYLSDQMAGISVANVQRPVGPNNLNRNKYENALREYMAKKGGRYYWWDE